MRILILSLPALFLCCGILWMVAATTLVAQKPTGRVNSLRRIFVQMSISVGIAFIVWAIAVIIIDIIHIAYPLVMAVVGVLLILQGWAFNKLKAF